MRFVFDLVQILPALLAEIFVRTRCLVHDSNTTPVLPDFTQVTLDEHTPNLIRQRIRWISGDLSRLQLDGAATESLATRSRQARIFLLTAETPSYFLFLII